MGLGEVVMMSENNQFTYKIISRAGSEVGRGFMNFEHALVSLRKLRQTGVKDAIVVNFKTVIDRKNQRKKLGYLTLKHKRIHSTSTSASKRPLKK